MGGSGYLPDPGGINDQSAKMLDAFATMADWEAQLKKAE
tara:strand:- start:6929 stop:7045 length:117 start_codon:yes stop_codon:yes gene_type:complete